MSNVNAHWKFDMLCHLIADQQQTTKDLHTNGYRDTVDCHVHDFLCLSIAVLSIDGPHHDALVIADHIVGHEAVDEAVCRRCAGVTACHQCNRGHDDADDKLINDTFCISFTVDKLRSSSPLS